MIRGDAGVGKSAMTENLVSRADRQGWRVVRATGVEVERAFALAGLTAIVFGLRGEMAGLGAHDRDVLAAVLGVDTLRHTGPDGVDDVAVGAC